MIKSAVANNKVVDEKDIDELIKQHLEEEKQLRQADDTEAKASGGKRAIKLKGADAELDDDEEDEDEDDIEDETLKKKKKLSSTEMGSKLLSLIHI